MPNYVSHSIMAEDFFDKLKYEKEIKIQLKKEIVKTFSIGQDYTFSNAKLFEKTHNENVDSYFINLITYITEEKLYNDIQIMGYLYGQIAHFAFDSILHPFVYSKELEIKRTGLISQHTTTEYFIDDYLSYKKYKIKTEEIDYNYFELQHFTYKKLKTLINSIYKKTYKTNQVYYTYLKTLFALKSLIKVSNLKIQNQSLLKKILKYDNFFKINNIKEDYILNQQHQIWVCPFSNKKSCDSFDDLYEKAIEKAILLSIEANNYIYGDRNLQRLILAFPNISYDTGIDCKKGKKIVYKNR